MTPESRYQQDLKKDNFSYDPAQEEAVQQLQHLFEQLTTDIPRPSWLKRFNPFASTETNTIRGLYFWGGVGRGKTYLMDTFYDCLPFPEKKRLHFHHFMRWVHGELKKHSGEKNPLEKVAETLAAENRVICFDEFFVSDITDAMLLGGLFKQVFQRGMTLVATSNVVPDDLYKDGLQRARFLPAIAQLKKHTRVVNVDGGTDYRLRLLEKAETYFTPLGPEAEQHLQHTFNDLVPDISHCRETDVIEIAGRSIPSERICEDIAWFSFAALCDGPRSQNDYIELACLYQTVILENVPQMGQKKDDQARRFISLVDEFYDRNVKLIVTAETPLLELYTSGKLHFEFQRTISRLQEMQSKEYLSQPHDPIVS